MHRDVQPPALVVEADLAQHLLDEPPLARDRVRAAAQHAVVAGRAADSSERR